MEPPPGRPVGGSFRFRRRRGRGTCAKRQEINDLLGLAEAISACCVPCNICCRGRLPTRYRYARSRALGASLQLRLEAFTKLSAADKAGIARLSSRTVRRLSARQDLIKEGDEPRALYLLVDGWACRYKELPDGRRQMVAIFVPGDIFDLNLSVLRATDHSIASITPIRVAEVGRGDLEELLAQHPRVSQALRWNELVAIAVQREWTLNLGQRSAYERLAHLSCELYLRLRAVGLTRGTSFDFPLTQQDLGEATGLTSVHVNRTLKQLRADGLVELDRRMLRIPDLESLMRAAMFNPSYLHLDREGRQFDAQD